MFSLLFRKLHLPDFADSQVSKVIRLLKKRPVGSKGPHLTALVAAVAKAPLVVVILRRIARKISAGQIIEQDLEAGIEQITPAAHQMIEQRLFVLQQ